MKDLDLQGIDWEPLPQFEGILDGNGHKISNLTIVKDTTDLGEIGLFRVFAGTVSNLELNRLLDQQAYLIRKCRSDRLRDR